MGRTQEEGEDATLEGKKAESVMWQETSSAICLSGTDVRKLMYFLVDWLVDQNAVIRSLDTWCVRENRLPQRQNNNLKIVKEERS